MYEYILRTCPQNNDPYFIRSRHFTYKKKIKKENTSNNGNPERNIIPPFRTRCEKIINVTYWKTTFRAIFCLNIYRNFPAILCSGFLGLWITVHSVTTIFSSHLLSV